MTRMRDRIRERPLKDGQTRYDVSVDYYDQDTGRRVQKWKTFRTKKEARDFLAQQRVDALHGMREVPASMTVGELFAEWLEAHRPHVKPTTHEGYRITVEKHILPYLGGLKLTQLTARRIERHYADLRKNGLGPRAIECVHKRLVEVLTYARRHRLVRVNEAQDAQAPPKVKPETQAWNEDEIRRFLAIADRSNYGKIWYVAVCTGMRRGELLGLRWQDVDEAKGVLYVRHTLTTLRGRLVEQTTKSGRPRTVAVDKGVLAILRSHRAEQAEWCLRRGPEWPETDLVFTTRLGTPIDPTNLRDDLNALILRAGVPRIRVHDLRHTHASWLLSHGRTVKEVSERLGHAKASMTLDVYAHALPDGHRETARLVDQLLAV